MTTTTTELPAAHPSRYAGYTDVPMWARDLEVGYAINERTETVVEDMHWYTDDHGIDRVVVTTATGEADFPIATGVITCTIAENWFGTNRSDDPDVTVTARCFVENLIAMGSVPPVVPADVVAQATAVHGGTYTADMVQVLREHGFEVQA